MAALCSSLFLGGSATVAPSATTPSSAAQRDAISQAHTLIRLRSYPEAEAHIRAVLASLESDSSLESAAALHLLAEVLWRSGRARNPEAAEAASRSLRLRLEALGADSPLVAEGLVTLSEIKRSLGLLAEAESLLGEAERVLRLRGAGTAAQAANVRVLLAVLWTEQANYQAAGTALDESIVELRSDPAADPLDLAFALTRKAILERKLGEDSSALESFADAEKVYSAIESEIGRPHPDSANVLVSRAILWDEQGRFDAAIDSYERAIAIWQPLYGSDSLRVAIVRHNFGLLLRRLGDYREAARRFSEARSTFEALYGPSHPYTLSTLQTEGELALLLGDFSTSKAHLEQVLSARLDHFGGEAPEIGTAHHRLGELALRRGDLSGAADHFAQANQIFASTLGHEHPDRTQALLGAGWVALARGDLTAARSAFTAAFDLEGSGGRADSPSQVDALQGLARVELTGDDPGRAEPLLRDALAKRRALLAPDHPVITETLTDLARLEVARGSYVQALDLALEAEALAQSHLATTISGLSEKQLRDYSSSRATPIDLAYEIATSEPVGPARLKTLFETQIAARGMGYSEMLRRRRTLRAAGTERARELADIVSLAAQRLANLSNLPATQVDPAIYGRLQREWERASLDLTDLESRPRLTLDAVDSSDLYAELPEGSALVSYVRYRRSYDAHGSWGRPTDSHGYAAWVLRQGRARPTLVPLGDAVGVDDLVEAWRLAVSRSGTPDPEPTERGERLSGDALRRLIWDPLRSQLNGTETVFVVADGALAQVAFPALPASSEGGYLLEAGPLFHTLERERDLLRLSGLPLAASGLLAVGGPAFDRRVAYSARAEAEAESRTRGPEPRTSTIPYLPPLPRTAVEVQVAARIWEETTGGGSLVLVGEEASEREFRHQAGRYGALHVATHTLLPTALNDPSLEAPFRSGLALAGFNRLGKSESAFNDGLLTAAEISMLDLSRTALVVLNACDSGSGAFVRNEGILGLRSGFQVAGVASLVLTLWPVEDRDAEDWSERFYRALPRVGFNVPEAVRQASRALLSEGRSAASWAPFVSLGATHFQLESQGRP